ncbi:MAG: citrate synthase [Bacteroidetes bacterium]|nr:citrate synthase [Bacteroidota bacterium]MCL5034842.1 citrate synthase [Bacteroidota bacterium]
MSAPNVGTTEPSSFSKGLEGIVAGQSAICYIDGQMGQLIYRGISIDELATDATFEEIIYLLWHGTLPKKDDLIRLQKELSVNRGLPDQIIAFIKSVPRNSNPMDVLRTAVSFLGIYDEEAKDNSIEANWRKSVRLVAKLPTIVANFHTLRQNGDYVKPDSSLGQAANFLYMINGVEPGETASRTFDCALVLHADHEFNASTFSARVTAATLSDMYSSMTSAIGTLKGPLHGGANEEVMDMLLKIKTLTNIEAYLQKMFSQKKKVPGFGHRVYKVEDPRAKHLRKFSKRLGETIGNLKWYEMSEKIAEYVKKEKNLVPNVDFYSASTYYYLGIPVDLFTPIFAMSRVAGWTAHVMEQYSDNRLIRPVSEYTGPHDVHFVPIENR